MKLRLIASVLPSCALVTVLSGQGHSQKLGTESPAVEAHKEKASALVGSELGFVYNDRCAPRMTPAMERAAGIPEPPPEQTPPPAHVFDNLYYVGLADVASWAISTPTGVVLLDALNNGDEAKEVVESGIRRLGIRPSRVISVIIMHGHGDHFGGSRYFQAKRAQVMASGPDWEYMSQTASNKEAPKGWAALVPEKGRAIADGESLTAGKSTLKFYVTPGHTPGTLSAILPVTFNGQRHVVAFWGGTGYPIQKDKLRQYIASLDRFTDAATAAGADVFLSNHSHTDGAVAKIAKIDWKRGTNPMIGGKAYVGRLLGLLNECAKAQFARP